MSQIFEYLSFNFSLLHTRNITVRIGAVIDEPYVLDCFDKYPTKKCLGPGVEAEFIYTMICDIIGFKIAWFRYDTSEELFNALDRREIDIFGYTFGMVPQFTSRWNYTKPIASDSPSFIVKKKFKSSNNNFWISITWDLWMGLLLLSLITFSTKRSCVSMQKFCDYVFKNVFFVKFFTTFWFIILGVIINLFGNLIAVHLSLPDTEEGLPFESMPHLGELLLQQKCKLATLSKYKNSSMFAHYFFNASHDKIWANTFRLAYRLNPPIFVEDRNELAHAIISNRFCIVGLDFATSIQYYKNGFCHLKTATLDDEFITGFFVYYHKLEQYIGIFDSVSVSPSLMNYGDYLFKKYLRTFPAETCENQMKVKIESIPLAKIKDSFLVLLGGISISFFIFFVLVMFWKCNCRIVHINTRK